MTDGYHRDDADDERLMNLRGDILQAFDRGLKAGCSPLDVLMCAASAVAELAAAGGHQDITMPLIAFASAARSAHGEAWRRHTRAREAREYIEAEGRVYRPGAARRR